MRRYWIYWEAKQKNSLIGDKYSDLDMKDGFKTRPVLVLTEGEYIAAKDRARNVKIVK